MRLISDLLGLKSSTYIDSPRILLICSRRAYSTEQPKDWDWSCIMGQIKECGVRNRLSSGRTKNQFEFGPAGQSDRSKSSRIETDGARVKRPSFAEDFMLEHSHAGLLIAIMGSAVRYGSAPAEPLHPTQYYGFPS
ncbi:MAG: hypothetical protein WB425_18440 [Terracidiphilus sp.]